MTSAEAGHADANLAESDARIGPVRIRACGPDASLSYLADTFFRCETDLHNVTDREYEIFELGHLPDALGFSAYGSTVTRRGYGMDDLQVSFSSAGDVLCHVPPGERSIPYTLFRSGRRVHVYSGQSQASILTSVAREIWRREVENLGGVIIHAGCAALADGTGVLIAGPKGAGKTSALLSLGSCGATIVENDRTALFLRDGRIYGTSVPITIRIGRGTLRGLGILAGLPEAAADRIYKRKIGFTRRQLAETLKARLKGSAEVHSLVFPRRCDVGLALEPITRDKVRKRLLRYQYTPQDPGLPGDLLGLRSLDSREVHDNGQRILARLADIPAFGAVHDGASKKFGYWLHEHLGPEMIGARP